VLWETASQTKVLLFAWSQTFASPKVLGCYTTGRTSNDRDDNKKIDNHQHDTIVTKFLLRHKTWNIFLFLGWCKLGCFFCLVPPLVRNFNSVAKTLLQQTYLIQVLRPRTVQLFIILRANKQSTNSSFSTLFNLQLNNESGTISKVRYCCDQKSWVVCAQSFALRQQATIEIILCNLSYFCLLVPCIHLSVLRAHPVRGESHNQRNTTGEVATTSLPFTTNHTDCTFFVWRLNLARPPHPGHSTILFDRKSWAACALSFALRQQGTIEIMHRNLSYYWLLAPRIYIFVLCAHRVCGESHNQRNTTGEVATIPKMVTKCFDSTIWNWAVNSLMLI